MCVCVCVCVLNLIGFTFFSFLPKETPLLPFSTMKQVIPLGPVSIKIEKFIRTNEKKKDKNINIFFLNLKNIEIQFLPSTPVRVIIRYTSLSPPPLTNALVPFKT